jgi:hypothetical protein
MKQVEHWRPWGRKPGVKVVKGEIEWESCAGK